MQLRCENCSEGLNNPAYLEKNYLTACPNCHTWLYFNSQKQDIEIIGEIRPKEHPLGFLAIVLEMPTIKKEEEKEEE